MSLNFSDNKYEHGSLHDEKGIVLKKLASVINSTGKVASISKRFDFSKALTCLNTLSQNIETAGSEPTNQRIFNCR